MYHFTVYTQDEAPLTAPQSVMHSKTQKVTNDILNGYLGYQYQHEYIVPSPLYIAFLTRVQDDYSVLDYTYVIEKRPTIVCLCGSTRFSQAFQQANLDETLTGNIVLTVGCDTKSDEELFQEDSTEIKQRLDILHMHKILLADEILVLNVGGYIGESTANEIVFAELYNKPVRYLEDIHP
jgi:hypothetical protein